MSEGRKLYSLIIKDTSDNYYRLKINGEYYHPLAVIDAYTTKCKDKQCFLEGRSTEFKLDIDDAFVLYKKGGFKALPIVCDNEDIAKMAPKFGTQREIDPQSLEMRLVGFFAGKFNNEYLNNKAVNKLFNHYGDNTVIEALKTNDFQYLMITLRDYRRFRKAALLSAGDINVHPRKIEIDNGQIIDSDEVKKKNILEEIKRVQDAVSQNEFMDKFKEERLDKLFSELEDLEAEETPVEEKNGQMRLFK